MAEKKRSEVEIIKENSDYLRGSLVQSLDNKITGALYPDDTQLIKFHGAYQQTDRDLESERKTQKLEPLYSMMIRIRVPGGGGASPRSAKNCFIRPFPGPVRDRRSKTNRSGLPSISHAMVSSEVGWW